jgi:hypothetical protein
MQFKEWLERQDEGWFGKKPEPQPQVYHKDPVTGEIKPGALPPEATEDPQATQAQAGLQNQLTLYPWKPEFQRHGLDQRNYELLSLQDKARLHKNQSIGRVMGVHTGPANSPMTNSRFARQGGVGAVRKRA